MKGSDIDTRHRADYNDPAGEVGYRMKKQGGNEGDPEGGKKKKRSPQFMAGCRGIGWSGRHLCLLSLYPDKDGKQTCSTASYFIEEEKKDRKMLL